jgi:hypothetical protein
MPRTFIKSYAPLPLLEWAVGRRRRVFALGTPKSGTTSIAGMFASQCRAAHEPHRPATVAAMHDHFVGKISDGQMREKYRERDKQLLLDIESNCFLAYRPDLLHSVFPDAKYLVIIRHPVQWLDSILDNNINFPRTKTATMTQWHNVLFSTRNESTSKQDDLLIERGLYPVDCYLAYWARTYERCLHSLRNARVLVVGTCQITRRMQEIGDFVGLDLSSVNPRNSHRNTTLVKHNVLAEFDKEFIENSVNKNCGALISQYDLESLWKERGKQFDD